ncbi:MAG: hypothetical protein ACREXT_16830, partial [Gammaproteobacteria bacterium]
MLKSFAAILLIVWSAASPNVRALTTEEIATRIAEIERTVPEPNRQRELIEIYRQAQGFISARVAHLTAEQEAREASARAPTTRDELLKKIAQLERAKGTAPVSQRELTLDATSLEQLYEQTRAERISREGKLSSYELRLRALEAQPAESARQKAFVTARMAELEAQSATPASASDDLSRARALAVEAELAARHTELDALNQEDIGRGFSVETQNLRREVSLLEIERLSARAAALEQALSERRQSQTESAQAAALQARLATSDAHPLAKQLAQDN